MGRWRAILLGLTALSAGAAGAQDAATYTIDAAASDIHWRVYKAGAFARLGHNHVISVADLAGTVTHDGDSAQSSFELAIPVASLVVDDPELRAANGEDFSSEPSAEDIAGTRRNMLSEDVLDAANHPMLLVRGKIASGTLDAATFAITVELLGRSVALSAPGSIVIDGDTLVASGEFRVTHADLGMRPFSVALGALAVAEPLDVSYRVRAHRAVPARRAASAPDPIGLAAAVRPLPRPLR
jgi:hypothetical protein